jgi:hypothetical protein
LHFPQYRFGCSYDLKFGPYRNCPQTLSAVDQVLKQLNDRQEDLQFFHQTIAPHVLQALSSDLTTTESCQHYKSFFQPPLPDSVMHQGKNAKKGKRGKGKKGKGEEDEEKGKGKKGKGGADGEEERAKAKAKANTLKQRKMMRLVLQQTEGLVKKDGLYHRCLLGGVGWGELWGGCQVVWCRV